ncbi:MAG: type II 3-dehydroquinate dehydratase [Oscillospiraceae bacterium]|nr:type II 3-dehydroquinate dehydratase [Oscillospiraceae bacterium]
MKKKILIINGPNLDMLSKREPEVYGTESLDDINSNTSAYAESLNLKCDFFQSNCEGKIIDKIHSVLTEYDGCIINAGAYTHYSYAIFDAIKSVSKPFVEVHMSNVHKREEFRHKSVISAACAGVIAGFGSNSYILAVNALNELVK